METAALPLGSRRNEDIALDLMKFIAMTTGYGKTIGAESVSRAEARLPSPKIMRPICSSSMGAVYCRSVESKSTSQPQGAQRNTEQTRF